MNRLLLTGGPPLLFHGNKQTIYSSTDGGWTRRLYGYDPYNNNEPIYIYGNSYAWAPSGNPEGAGGSVYLMPTGQLTMGSDGKWHGTFGGENSSTLHTVNYTITDTDGASAKATYKLTVHEPIEKEREQSYNVWAYCPVWGSGALPGNANGVMQPNGPFQHDGQNNPSVSAGHGSSQGLSVTISGEFGFEDLGAGFGASIEWSDEQSSNVEGNWPINIDVPNNSFTYPLFEDKYIRHEYFYRHFTPEGEHKLPSVEFPPGSGYYDTPTHEWHYDEPSGRTIVWAPPLPLGTAIPNYTSAPARPTPIRSGGQS